MLNSIIYTLLLSIEDIFVMLHKVRIIRCT